MTDNLGSDITQLLLNWRKGDGNSLPQLMHALSEQLLRIAEIQFARERADHTLEPAALISELYLRLEKGVEIDWKDRSHFYAVSATIMRRILVEHARRYANAWQKEKRESLTLAEALLPEAGQELEVLDLDRALTALEAIDEAQHRVVMLRFFGGLGVEEIAEVMGVNRRTVHRKWTTARVWLLGYLKGLV